MKNIAAYLEKNRDVRLVVELSIDAIVDAPADTTGFWVGFERRDDKCCFFDAVGPTIDDALAQLDADAAIVLALPQGDEA